MSERDQPIRTPLPQRLADFKRRRLPLIVWSLALLACLWMLQHRAWRFEYIGLAQSLRYEVSSGITGRLDTLVVNLYDEVEQGDVVAKLDDSLLAASVQTVQARIRQLQAELDATRIGLLTGGQRDLADWTTDLRRFQASEEERRLAVLDLRATLEGDLILVERLNLDVNRDQTLLEAGVIGKADFDRTLFTRKEAQTRIDENRIVLAQAEKEYRAAQTRRQEFETRLPSQPGVEPLLRPLSEAIDVENRVLEEIGVRREALFLRSPIRGQVSQVLCRQGQAVVPGEPILTVSDRSVSEIIAYQRESDRRLVAKRDEVVVASRRVPTRVAESFVIRVGTGLDVLPQRLWRDPAVPDYGRAFVVAAIPDLGLIPGEVVDIRFIR